MDPKYTLDDRTFEFSDKLIKYFRSIPKDYLIQPILLQAIRSGTSIGANYREAEGRESTKDFVHKVMIVKKEAKETLYWLKLLESSFGLSDVTIKWLIDECSQLIRIFGKIVSNKTGV